MVFHWSLSDKSPQVSRARFNNLADLNSTVVWMVSTRPLISKSCSPFFNPLVTVTRTPITTGINVTFMFHVFFFIQFPSKVKVFILLFAFFQFYPVVSRDYKVKNFASSLFTFFFFFFFLVIIIRSGCQADIKWSVCKSKSQRSLYVSFSRTDVGLCLNHFIVWSNFNFLHDSQWFTLPTQSCLFFTLSVLTCCIRLLCDW